MKDNFALELINKQIVRTQGFVEEYTKLIVECEESIKGYTKALKDSEDRLSDLLDAARVIKAAYA